MFDISIEIETWKYRVPFEIARGIKTEDRLVVVTVREDSLMGRGEGVPVYYSGESVESVIAQLEAVKKKLRHGMHPDDVQVLLPRGAARNAIDCALWDLESRRRGEPVWKLAGLDSFGPLSVTMTLGINTPEEMARAAGEAALPLLKIKLKGDGLDIERVAAIRARVPDSRLIVDANEGWTAEQVSEYVPQLERYGVELIEQPMMSGSDQALAGYDSPIPLCADESSNDLASVKQNVGRYEFVNIKLDKSGGLTEALAVARAAKTAGLRLMVGCMAGTSLSMAAGAVVGQLCEFVDLDGPLLYAGDRTPAASYENGVMTLPKRGLWGEG